MTDASGANWRDRLSEAGEEELDRLLAEHRDELDPKAVLDAFHNPFVTRRMVESLLEQPRLVSAYEVRRAAAYHPLTPRTEALRYVAGLYWADLVRLGVEIRVHPIVRRAADRRLIDRLPGLAVGEKMAIARGASATVVAFLRHDPTPRVIAALLENPRLTEGLLLPLAADENASPQALAVVAGTPRWASRYPIRAALCRNPRTPLGAGLALLPTLQKKDLEAVATDARLLLPLRRRAQLLAGAGAEGGRGL